jgi:hypothetical protein
LYPGRRIVASSRQGRTPPRPRRVGAAPEPANGVWIEFNGPQWEADGAATSSASGRFEPVGQYRGFPVYRHKANAANEIWVQVGKDGPLAPYAQRSS